eukprot:UN14598
MLIEGRLLKIMQKIRWVLELRKTSGAFIFIFVGNNNFSLNRYHIDYDYNFYIIFLHFRSTIEPCCVNFSVYFV